MSSVLAMHTIYSHVTPDQSSAKVTRIYSVLRTTTEREHIKQKTF